MAYIVDYTEDRVLRTHKPSVAMVTLLRTMKVQGHVPLRRGWGNKEFAVSCGVCRNRYRLAMDTSQNKVVMPGIEECPGNPYAHYE